MFAGLTLTLAALGAASTPLDELDLSTMTQEWGSAGKTKSVDGNAIRIGGQTFERGVGTHANSMLIVDLGGTASRFRAKVGVDDEVGERGSVRFKVVLDGKVSATSPVMRGGQPAHTMEVPLEGVKQMRLEVDDGGDDINYDHADWADAVIEGGSPKAVPAPKADGPVIPLAAPNLSRTEIHGPRVIGGTPGHDFLFRIPVSGRRPMRFTATGLPEGLSLDTETGIVRGQIAKAGTYSVRVTASGAGGVDRRTIQIVGGRGKLALTPPMGWNSWNVWGTSVDADKVRDAAKAFVDTGLADYGYAFVNIDDAWEGKRDAKGVLQTNEKFPDMRNLSDSVHRYGLKLGIYSSPGPKTCAGYEGSYNFEKIDANTWAEWGIDYLKHDWCSYGSIAQGSSRTELMRPYLVMREALDECGRDIVYSLCQYGMGDVHTWGNRVGGDLWRTTGDITDTWGSLSSIGFAQGNRSPYAGPSGWNDPDMLILGYVGWGPSVRPTRLTPNEQVTHMTLWAMLAAPLLIGCDLTKLDDLTKSLLMNHEVIEIDQDPLGKAGVPVQKDGDVEVWSRPLWDGTTAVALFNRGLEAKPVRADWVKLGLKGPQPVLDCWSRKTKGTHSGSYTATVPAHGAILVKIGKPRS